MNLVRPARLRRVRRTVMWAGVAACALIAAAWVVSTRRSVYWVATRAGRARAWSLASGGFGWSMRDYSRPNSGRYPEGWGSSPLPGGRSVWWVQSDTFGLPPTVRSVRVPLWMPLVLCAAPTAWLWMSREREAPGHCPCGYSLAGLASGAACPECGKGAAT